MPKREVGEFWDCLACGAKLVGAKTINGKVAPIEIKLTPYGNCVLFRNGEEVRVATAPAEILVWLKAQGFELRMNHFATCPKAEHFQRRAKSEEQPSGPASTVTE